MRVGIDLTAIWRPITGLERVAIEMTQAMLRLDKTNEYVLFFSGGLDSRFCDFEHDFESVLMPYRNELLTKNIQLPFVRAIRSLDFMYFPVFPPPWLWPCQHGWIVPDATPWLFPETMKYTSRLYFRVLGARAMRKCRLLVTDTESSKQDLSNLFEERSDKIRVISPGVREIFREITDKSVLSSVSERYSLPKNFILCVATFEPRKNIVGLLRAFALLKSQGFEPSLVLVGRKGWLHDQIFEAASLHELQREIIFTGYVPDDDLVAIYNMATVFVYPSVYEGFGLPCIEAMACGCPVVTSNRGALLEVTGSAALHAAPENISGLAVAIRRVVDDQILRQTLKERGIERARLFSWDTYAEKTLSAFEEIVIPRTRNTRCIGRRIIA